MSTFPRSALTSTFTTSLDFALLTALVELGHVNYVLATCLGTVLGASTNFLINRQWAFRATAGHVGHQALRYLLVQLGSATLHTTGVWGLTQFAHVRYWLSKIIIAIAAYLAFNYPMNRWFVFPPRGTRSGTRRDLRVMRVKEDGTRQRSGVGKRHPALVTTRVR